MNVLTHNILTIMENYKSIEIEAIIKEMQMIADRKYQEEEQEREILENIQ